ncbi:IspD/TarI family cytidylyltransferase [Cellulomonas composti]|uniref:2-C-methyl-D-erythritol 4-phosphate cytidylyltransferase n=1 Tax=Cellulomonas composti TaxID=266130 RepID=A0A511JCT2_9CELL|nr:2-C-methyl-D-erythritol 4-phosphate cytidylyltransferase [Cellulomonas composti]GEL95746.1 2-C-methyl-D-erythritol 4-phosphate cytidylyltransferase [Cellulomonas composti]
MSSDVVVAVLTAAGSGSRLGHELPKALVPVGDEPLVRHAARRLLAADALGCEVAAVVVTAPASYVDEFRVALAGLPRVVVVPGGSTRQASVAAGLAALTVPRDRSAGTDGPSDDDPPDDGPSDDDGVVVLVHDAARAFAPPVLVARVVAAVRAGHPAVVPGLAVADTIKRVEAPDASGAARVADTVPRAQLRAVQTPQGFDLTLLRRAHAAAADAAHDETLAASDDAGLVERLGEPVWVVAGDPRAAKVTTAHDLAMAAFLAADEEDA